MSAPHDLTEQPKEAPEKDKSFRPASVGPPEQSSEDANLDRNSPGRRAVSRRLSVSGQDEQEASPKSDSVLGTESHMLQDVTRILSLTPEQRIREVANVARFLAAVRRV